MPVWEMERIFESHAGCCAALRCHQSETIGPLPEWGRLRGEHLDTGEYFPTFSSTPSPFSASHLPHSSPYESTWSPSAKTVASSLTSSLPDAQKGEHDAFQKLSNERCPSKDGLHFYFCYWLDAHTRSGMVLLMFCRSRLGIVQYGERTVLGIANFDILSSSELYLARYLAGCLRL